MRRLVYVGREKENSDCIAETTSYKVMKEYEEDFNWTVRLDEVHEVNEKVEKENEERRKKIAKKLGWKED